MQPVYRNILSQLLAAITHGVVKRPPSQWRPEHGALGFYLTAPLVSEALSYRRAALDGGHITAPWFYLSDGHGPVYEELERFSITYVLVPSLEETLAVLHGLESMIYQLPKPTPR